MDVAFNKIVAAVDLEDDLGNAVLITAATLAKRLGAKLHVIDAWPKLEGIGFPYARRAEIKEIQKHEAGRKERLSRLEKQVSKVSLDAVVMAPVGDVEDTIVTYLKNEGADLLIMGSHQRSTLGKLVLGSTSSEVTHHAKCAVLLVTQPFARQIGA